MRKKKEDLSHLSATEKKTVESYRSIIKTHSIHIADLMDKRRAIAEELALLLCPFSVGDRVIDRYGSKAEVSRIASGGSFDSTYRDEYVIFIKKIKKGGSLYTNESKVWHSQDKLKRDPNPGVLPD